MLAQIGDIEVWRILESVDRFFMPEDWFPMANPDSLARIRAMPGRVCPQSGQMLLPVQSFLLRGPDHTVLVDTGVGEGKACGFFPPWHRRSGARFLAGLDAAGVTPADIDIVLCTHLHPDHVGWNTRMEDGQWRPTFPNARYLFPAADEAQFSAEPVVYEESILPVIQADQAELVASDHRISDAISLTPTPGHTPGHVSVLIESGDARAIIPSDAIHCTSQCQAPHWHFRYDQDGARAVASRRALLERAAEGGHLVFGTHFVLPAMGRITASGDVFAWTPL